LEDVRRNLLSTGYPEEKCHFIKGDVLKTIPHEAIDEIAILRLDTDWYESTRHELQHLYPKLTRGGVLIVDDYGHWQGCRKAVDEYFTGRPPFMFAIDYTARMSIRL
jgi:O-methyltransferase